MLIGHTDNMIKRLHEHEIGSLLSTHNSRPLKLVYYEACLNEYDAKNREKYFKAGYGRRFLKNRLENYRKDLDIQARDPPDSPCSHGGRGGGQGTANENHLPQHGEKYTSMKR